MLSFRVKSAPCERVCEKVSPWIPTEVSKLRFDHSGRKDGQEVELETFFLNLLWNICLILTVQLTQKKKKSKKQDTTKKQLKSFEISE